MRDRRDTIPAPELQHSLTTFLAPLLNPLPDDHLQRVVPAGIRGIVTGETSVVDGALPKERLRE